MALKYGTSAGVPCTARTRFAPLFITCLTERRTFFTLGKNMSAYWHSTLSNLKLNPIFSASISIKMALENCIDFFAIPRAVLDKSIPTNAPSLPRCRDTSFATTPVPQARSSTLSADLMSASLTSSVVDLNGPICFSAQL